MNKKIMKFSISALALVMLFSGCNKDRDLKAKVGNVEIRAEQVNKEFEKLKKNLDQSQLKLLDESTEEGKRQVYAAKKRIAERLADEVVFDEIIKRENIKVDEKLVDNQINTIKTQLGDKYESELKKSYENEEEFKKGLKKNLEFKSFYEAFKKRNEIDDAQAIKSFNESKEKPLQLKATHVLVATKEEAEKVKERITKGEDISKVASEVSLEKGEGKLGYFIKGEMVREFYEAASKLNPGDISDPVKTKYGFHIIKLEEKETDINKFQEAKKTAVLDSYKNKIIDEKLTEYIEKIKKELRYKINF